MPALKETPERIIGQYSIHSDTNINVHKMEEWMMGCEEIRLVKPTLGLKNKALEYRQEHFDFGEQVINGSSLFDKIASYEEWLEKVIANANMETVDPDWVLTDTFFAVRVSDNKIVGIVDLRYQLNDFLRDFGHCGYSVRPSERRKGYAAEILKQICLAARKHGLKQLQLSAEKNNTASIKTIEKNGGNYCRSFTIENEEAYVYLINL